MKTPRDEVVLESAGNIYADLGVANPEEAQAKAGLMRLINAEIKRLGLTQTEAALRTGLAQSDVSNIARGRGRTYSMDRLLDVMHRLGIATSILARTHGGVETIEVFA